MSILPTHLNHADDQPKDRGSAMILTLMVMALVTVLSTTVAVVTINNLQSSWRSRQSGAALSAADAGIAQAVSYLRSAGVGDLQCSPSACKANWWGNKTSPTVVDMEGVADQSYEVWIEPIAPFPENDPGVYRIHSTGLAAGAASRPVTADVSISTTTSRVPKGIFANSVSGGGESVTGMSIFSTGCVSQRGHITFGEKGKKADSVVIDAAYGIPAAVHSSETISDKNSCSKDQSIHASEGTPEKGPKKDKDKDPPASSGCNTSFPYDQSQHGGLLTDGDGCYDSKMTGSNSWAKYYSTYDLDSDGKKDPSSLLESPEDMYSIFGFEPRVSKSHLDTLRMLAQSQGSYFTSASGWESPTTADNEKVLFFDLTKSGGTVDLKDLGEGFGRDPNNATDATCPTGSLTIVVMAGDVKLNGGAKLAATIILTTDGEPSGKVDKANGNSEFIGTIFAGDVDMKGSAKFSLDKCFLANAGPGLTEIAVTSYREDDRDLD